MGVLSPLMALMSFFVILFMAALAVIVLRGPLFFSGNKRTAFDKLLQGCFFCGQASFLFRKKAADELIVECKTCEASYIAQPTSGAVKPRVKNANLK